VLACIRTERRRPNFLVFASPDEDVLKSQKQTKEEAHHDPKY